MAEDNGVRFELNLFQRWQLLRDQIEVTVSPRQQRLISALAIHGSRHRRYLGGLLWPNSPEALALESLRASVHLISRQTPGLVVVNGPVLFLGDSLVVDVHNFLKQVRNCERLDRDSNHDGCLTYLLGDELLPGWYEDWVILEQHRLQNVRLRALLMHGRRWLERGEAEMAIEAADRALNIEPLHETCVGLMMQAELDMGNRAGALLTFEKFCARLTSELGVAPSGHLLKLAAAIHR